MVVVVVSSVQCKSRGAVGVVVVVVGREIDSSNCSNATTRLTTDYEKKFNLQLLALRSRRLHSKRLLNNDLEALRCYKSASCPTDQTYDANTHYIMQIFDDSNSLSAIVVDRLTTTLSRWLVYWTSGQPTGCLVRFDE